LNPGFHAAQKRTRLLPIFLLFPTTMDPRNKIQEATCVYQNYGLIIWYGSSSSPII
jgi:hypothetical protein